MKAKSTETDLTVGKPLQIIIPFMIPVLLSTLLQQFYNLVDTVFIGQFLGKHALAGVGATGSLNFMIVGFCIGIASGFTILVAQKFGAKDFSAMRKFIANGIITGAVVSVIVTVTTSLLCSNILKLMDTPDEIFQYSYDYILIIFLGIPITIAYNFFSGIIRSLGDSKTPFIFLAMASVINIGMDWLTLTVIPMGIRGPAIATLLSQLFSVVMCIWYIKKKFDVLKIEKHEWKIKKNYVLSLLGMGLPFGLQYSITAIGSVVLQGGVNSLGADTVAAFAAAGKINVFLGCPGESLGSTMATFAGQNMGAGKVERIQNGLWAATRLGIYYSIAIFIIMIFTSKYLLLMFVKPEETEIIAMASKFLIINSSMYSFLMMVNTFRFTIQGMGYSSLAVLAGVLEMVGRAIVGIALVPTFGYTSACVANPTAWILADAFLIPAFYYISGRTKRKLSIM